MMSKHSYRTAVLVITAALLGAVFQASLAPRLVDGQAKLIDFIKRDQFAAVKTVAVNTGGGSLLFITGQTGMSPEMKMAEDIGDQADAALENLGRELSAAGLKPTDVAKLTIYVKNLDLVEGGFVLRSVQTYFSGGTVPVITWVGVTGLVLPQALVEIEAVAVAGN